MCIIAYEGQCNLLTVNQWSNLAVFLENSIDDFERLRQGNHFGQWYRADLATRVAQATTAIRRTVTLAYYTSNCRI